MIRKFRRDAYDYLNNCVYIWVERLDNYLNKLCTRQIGGGASRPATESIPSSSGGTDTRDSIPSTSNQPLPQKGNNPPVQLFLGRGGRRGERPGGGRSKQKRSTNQKSKPTVIHCLVSVTFPHLRRAYHLFRPIGEQIPDQGRTSKRLSELASQI